MLIYDYSRGEFMSKKMLMCNAGYNVGSILPDGSVNVCFDRKDENLGSIFTGFEWKNELKPCDKVHCQCPLWAFDENLNARAHGKEEKNIIDWDHFFHWHITYECQMRCNYCTVTSTDKRIDTLDKLRKSKPIDVEAVMRTLDATGKRYHFSFIGGEPFMLPNMTELCAALTRKHYVSFNTNLCAMPLDFFEHVDASKVLTMHISLHIKPMEVRRLTEDFLQRAKIVHDAGVSNYYITTVAHPKLFPKIKEYTEFFGKHGIKFKLIPMLEGGFSTDGKVYPDSYTEEELAMIDAGWLDNYFPEKNAKGEKVNIKEFRPKNPDNTEHSFKENK